MQVGDQCRDTELPFEAHGQIEHDTERGDQQRQRAVLGQLAPDLRADEFHPLQLGTGIGAGQGFDHQRGLTAAVAGFLERHADQHIA